MYEAHLKKFFLFKYFKMSLCKKQQHRLIIQVQYAAAIIQSHKCNKANRKKTSNFSKTEYLPQALVDPVAPLLPSDQLGPGEKKETAHEDFLW